jgi:hypothetical protein
LHAAHSLGHHGSATDACSPATHAGSKTGSASHALSKSLTQRSRLLGAGLLGDLHLGAQTDLPKRRFEFTNAVGDLHDPIFISGCHRFPEFGVGTIEIGFDLGRFFARFGHRLADGLAHLFSNCGCLLLHTSAPGSAATTASAAASAHHGAAPSAAASHSHGRLGHCGQRQKKHRRGNHQTSQCSCFHFPSPPCI